MSNTFDKLSVLDSFIEEVNSYLPEIEANLARLAQSPGDMEAIEETYRRTHTIGGSASMMDFPGLAHVAHGMEDILGDVLDGLASLDAPTLGLLQRSFARMHRLVQGIREGVDEDAIIAEDDADYVQYRALIDNGGVQQVGNGSVSNELWRTNSAPLPTEMPASSSAVMPSIDEVLASFRTTPTVSGEDIGWPEEPAFYIPVEALAHFRQAVEQGVTAQAEWRNRFDSWAMANPILAKEWADGFGYVLPEGWDFHCAGGIYY